MASSTTRRPSWRTVTPVLAVAAFGLAACTSSQESSDVAGTTPPVWTSSPAPAGEAGGHGSTPGGREGDDHGASAEGLEVELKDGAGADVGTATIVAEGNHLVVTVEAQGLTPGFHGLHFHQNGTCEGDFTSAGGHLQVGAADAHPSSGDLTSLQVGADGTAKLVTRTDTVTLDQVEGKSLIVHSGADNFGNIPPRYTREGGTGPDETTLSTGDAGSRVACGVVG
ncbi:superoxide dismutase[Cu-Zn] [Nocardia mangyaensis]|uniref:superoxide dismutase[Cu-Zn] n=1 Tax=Nocardia mangyaensis TaxID=2213200 RepID=UPI0026757C37|nr:superoxide dismutase family protein [Nocardia mangyaensis]MDO3648882.1 superoxide dismutase family protein [Nocardia mangyaensis]